MTAKAKTKAAPKAREAQKMPEGFADPQALKLHPVLAECQMLPEDHEDCVSMVDSISRRGVLDPIDLDGAGLVVDGAHRLRAALIAGAQSVPVRTVEADNVIAYIAERNRARKHMVKTHQLWVMMPILTERAMEGKVARAAKMNGKHTCAVTLADFLAASGISETLYRRVKPVWEKAQGISEDKRGAIVGKFLRREIDFGGLSKAVGYLNTAENEPPKKTVGELRAEHARILAQYVDKSRKQFEKHWGDLGKADKAKVCEEYATQAIHWPEEVKAAVLAALGGAE